MSVIDDAIDQIEAFIIANGNEEITADVLRPLLVGLGDAVKTVTGDPANLNTLATNLVSAINEVLAGGSSGIVIKTGTTDPNVTPPISYSLGNFYARYFGSTLLSFWQYNGYDWVEIRTQTKGILTTSDGNINVQPNDYTIIYEDGVTSNDINIGSPEGQTGRILKIINRDASPIDITDTGYINYSALAVTTIPANTGITIQSDGASWNLI